MITLKIAPYVADDNRISVSEINDLIMYFVTTIMLTIIVTGSILQAIKVLEIENEPESYPFGLLDAIKGYINF